MICFIAVAFLTLKHGKPGKFRLLQKLLYLAASELRLKYSLQTGGRGEFLPVFNNVGARGSVAG
jgi:hypothetical protein